jgi:hypothetical protein
MGKNKAVLLCIIDLISIVWVLKKINKGIGKKYFKCLKWVPVGEMVIIVIDAKVVVQGESADDGRKRADADDNPGHCLKVL